MYEIFRKLCEERQLTPYRVSKETGVTTATLTSWKQGKYEPKREKLQKLADYFGVSLEYLMTGKEISYTKEKARILARFAKFDEKTLKVFEKYGNLSETDRKSVCDMIDFLYSKNNN